MSTDKTLLTDKETRLLGLSFLCLKGDMPAIDYEKLASLSGYTAGSASVTLGKIRRKIKAAAEEDGAGGTTTPASTPKKPSKRKADTGGSPTKKKKPKTPTKKATPSPVAEADGGAADDDDEVSIKLKEEDHDGSEVSF